MSDKDGYYATLGLSPDATFDQVKARFRELNDAYLKILELSRSAVKPAGSPAASAVQPGPKQKTSEPEPISEIKERFAAGKINKTQFDKLAKERYEYLKNKPFAELSDEELEERLKGFEGLNIYPKYMKSKT